MTLSTTISSKKYTGDASTTVFSFPYLFYDNAHLYVYVDDTLQFIDSNYTVTGAGADGGGAVTFLSAPSSGAVVHIKRIVPRTQATDFEDFDGNPSDVTEKALDLGMMAVQQVFNGAEDRNARDSDFSKTSSTALTAAISLSVDANSTYEFLATLYTTSSASGGVKASMNTTGGATVNNIIYEAEVTESGVQKVPVTTRATARGTAVGEVTAVTAATIKIRGSVEIGSSGGTLFAGFAQNVSNGTASKVLRGSTLVLHKIS